MASDSNPDADAEPPEPTTSDDADRGDEDALRRIADRNPTRLGVGRSGPRPTTEALLEFRADHGVARDAVHSRVSDDLLKEFGLVRLRTRVADTDQYLARPDLGRELDADSLERLERDCEPAPEVQLVVSDGLSSSAVEANVPQLLPALLDGLEARGISVGTPVFVESGRVDVMDAVGEELEADCCVNLIGERPGLRTAESLSAYLVYGPERGSATAKKSVVSNIHDGGLPPVEAGAELVDLIAEMLDAEASGVDLREDDREFRTE
ncbi:ethanolamine ammonia-lyase small subunit [Natronococcus amylolyticus DSM 10524]|uniref:Putative ethanolamine ammonia-lyase small subunit n=1 Tax=Natronococcus amylolyticus DSM 10524 TaxID=1227497 RepID=L9XEL9_9EURY|nr:ethanolamine ammonia-lyase subunit EutC [Natronococcus amylolyticus]ELY59876.1 ethanolamine ammonia-lyase small subunit [Natronococcus amylolyticus DSM 10524]